MKTLNTILRGSFFKRKSDSKAVYVKGHYCRTLKKWSCVNVNDHCQELFLRSETQVFTDFTF